MGRINNQQLYPQNDPVSINDFLIGTDFDTGVTKTFSIASLLGLGGEDTPTGDTFSTLSGRTITFPDGQVIEIPIDTDTDTFATINSGVITFADGSTFNLGSIDTDTFATLRTELVFEDVDISPPPSRLVTFIDFPDGQSLEITDESATLAGNVITFPTGQTITIPNPSTDDQIASEVPVQTNSFNGNLQSTDDTVQKALDRIDDLVLGSSDNYTIDIIGNNLNLLNNGTIVSSDSFASIDSVISNTITGHRIATHTSGSGTVAEISETVTTLQVNANVLEYVREDGVTDTVDLSLYLDDTNLARLVSGTLDNNTGVATFTRDDNTTFTLDLSALLNTVTASNGLNKAGNDIRLGGTLDQDVIINTNGNGFNVLGGGSFYNLQENFFGASVNGNISLTSTASTGGGFQLLASNGFGNIVADGINIQSNDGQGLSLNTDHGNISFNSVNNLSISSDEIRLIKTGNTPSVGDVWTSTGTDGRGEWSTPSGGGTNPTGLERVSATNGNTGLRIIGKDPFFYGDIGFEAVDLSDQTNSSNEGATGSWSLSSGLNTSAIGDFAVSTGSLSRAISDYSRASGRESITTGIYSTAEGYAALANSYGEFAVGLWTESPTSGSTTSFVPTDRIFNVGNGQSSLLRSNAFTVLKNGLVFAPSVTNTLIDGATGDALITKDWFNANNSGGGSGTTYTFENGLTESSGNVKLGGDLVEDTTINLDSNFFRISGQDNFTDRFIMDDGTGRGAWVQRISVGVAGGSSASLGAGNPTGQVFIDAGNRQSLPSTGHGIHLNSINLDVDSVNRFGYFFSADNKAFRYTTDVDVDHPFSVPTRNYVDSKVTGLEAIDEGSGIGWRLRGRNPDNYGNIGLEAVDLSTSTAPNIARGATGNYAHAEGRNTVASGSFSHAEGSFNTASGSGSHAEGDSNTASGEASHAEGRFTIASGLASHAGGQSTFARALAETSIGMFGTDYTAFNESTLTQAAFTQGLVDRVFNVGNGTGADQTSNAFTIYKNGAVQLYPVAQSSITNAQTGMLIMDSNDSDKLKIHVGGVWREIQLA